ncbi:hypothetical protein ANO11243_045810 [Dothideomycetidae sp. 11243]|nr:hypothetical protein ANO11243_045810 [fungal sp. No.11243]
MVACCESDGRNSNSDSNSNSWTSTTPIAPARAYGLAPRARPGHAVDAMCRAGAMLCDAERCGDVRCDAVWRGWRRCGDAAMRRCGGRGRARVEKRGQTRRTDTGWPWPDLAGKAARNRWGRDQRDVDEKNEILDATKHDE